MASPSIYILSPDYHENHVKICNFIVADVLKYGINKNGYKCEIIFVSTRKGQLRTLLNNNTVIVFTPWLSHLDNINCKIILYNTESLKSPVFGQLAKKCINDPRVFQIWDYCYNNLLLSKSNKKHIVMPIGYSPNNEFPIKQHKKIFDIIFYGTHLGTHPGDKRFKRREMILNAINKISNVFDDYNSDCLDTKFYTSYYKELNNLSKEAVLQHWLEEGQFQNRQCCTKKNGLKNFWITRFKSLKQKIDYIGASKIVLIIHTYDCDKPIDYFRMTELIKNKCFFIMETPQDSEKLLYEKYKNYIVFSDYDKILENCMIYLKKTQAERNSIAEKLYQFWKNEEDMSHYIKYSLSR
jgi:hypothetical protein